ncbi:MAG: serpin family protein [Ruminococcus sp.]|nr:serpin family protein [Ruminococcus sp.]
MRKSEKISDAIGLVDEEIVAEAEEIRLNGNEKNSAANTRLGKKVWIPTVTAAACAAVICGALVLGGGDSGDISTDGSETSSLGTLEGVDGDEGNLLYLFAHVETLAEAEYPVMAKYPNEDDCFDENGVWQDELAALYYYPWEEQGVERRQAGSLLVYDSLTGFVMSTSNEFLTGSDGENRVYSPGSAYMALAMLAETTDGNSRCQILDLFGADSIEDLREQAENMWKANYRNDGATTSVLANSLWLNEDVNFNSGTVNRLADSYRASSYRGDMSSEEMTAALRDWLNEQTGGLLGDAVENVSLDPETVMSLCSTVYFRAKWDYQFSAANNEFKTFHGPDGDIETEFMNNTNDYGPYYWGEDYGAVYLAFADGGGMWLILPDEDKTVDDVLASSEYLDMVNTGYGWEKSKSIIVHYSVPKFDVSSELTLAEGLKRLGITDVFDSDLSDFTPLTNEADGIFVSDAKQAARVQIDEEGCTAAAFTQMLEAGAALPPEDEIYFMLDRPFVFVIESDTKQPLFIGTVYNPL